MFLSARPNFTLAQTKNAERAGAAGRNRAKFRFVSLGSDCQTAAQINGLRNLPARHFFETVGCPIAKTFELLECDFRDLLLPENLLPVYHDEVLNRVIDLRYHLHFVHDFQELSPSEIKAVRDRYELRARWFRELLEPDEEPVYFVRRWHPMDGPEDESLAARLYEFLRSSRRDIRFLYLHNDPSRPERASGAYRSAYLAPPANPSWTGNNQAWRRALRVLAVTPDDCPDGFPLQVPWRSQS